MERPGRLEGKVAFITGAGAGMGRATALAMAREGARLMVADLCQDHLMSLHQEVLDLGGSCTIRVCDVSVDTEVEQALATAFAIYQRLDIVHACAGIVPEDTVEKATYEAFERAMRINVWGPMIACKYAVPLMRHSGGGVIIVTGSVAGMIGLKHRALYSITKQAVAGLVSSLAADFVGDNIRAHVIAPGTVLTPSLEGRIQVAASERNVDPQVVRNEFTARQPIGRLGNPEAFAELAVFLASDAANYATGCVYTMDGGLTSIR